MHVKQSSTHRPSLFNTDLLKTAGILPGSDSNRRDLSHHQDGETLGDGRLMEDPMLFVRLLLESLVAIGPDPSDGNFRKFKSVRNMVKCLGRMR